MRQHTYTSTDEPSLVEFAPIVGTPEVAIGTVPEILVITLVLKELATGLAPALSGTTSVPIDTIHIITERVSGNASTELAPAMNIMEELAHQIVQ